MAFGADKAKLVASLELEDKFTRTADAALRKTGQLEGDLTKLGRAAGISAAAGTFAFNAMSTAIAGAGDFIGDATRQFIADEQSVARLSAALKASVVAWNGNTAAIEATIKARMRLGFTDDEQRNALALAVTATNDVSEALAILGTAMDLARLKSISLEDATSKLIKIEGGNFRALKELGIEIDENATQTEALIAVQKAADGQAKAYAETTGGKLVQAQVRAGEATERLGGIFARLGAVILPAVADGLDSVLNLIDGVASSADKAENPINSLLRLLPGFASLQDLQIKVNEELAQRKAAESGGFIAPRPISSEVNLAPVTNVTTNVDVSISGTDVTSVTLRDQLASTGITFRPGGMTGF